MTKADDDEIEAMPLVPDGNVELSHTAEESGEASKAIEASNQTDVGLQRLVGPRDSGTKRILPAEWYVSARARLAAQQEGYLETQRVLRLHFGKIERLLRIQYQSGREVRPFLEPICDA